MTQFAQEPGSGGGQRSASPARTVAVIVAGVALVTAVALWLLAGKRYGDAVADLAPAPVGCDTTLAFERTGTFTFFVETRGDIDSIDGDCGAEERDYDYDGDVLPRVSITLRDDNGDELDLDRVSEPSYDQGGSRGAAVRTARIGETGDYTVTVDSNVDDIVVRVGRDPAQGVTAMRVGAFLALLVALGAGLFAALAGRQRTATPAGPDQRSWQPMPGHPPPIAPPYAQVPPNPPYTWPPSGAPGPRPMPPPPSGWGPGRGGQLPPPTLP